MSLVRQMPLRNIWVAWRVFWDTKMYGLLVQVEKPQPKRNYNMKFPAPPPKKKRYHKLLNLLFLDVSLFLRLKIGGPKGWGKIFVSRDLWLAGLGWEKLVKSRNTWPPGMPFWHLTNNHPVPNYFKFVWLILNKFRKYVWKLTWNPKNRGGWKKILLFNWVILRWTMLTFRSVYPPIPANSSGSFVFWPFSAKFG